MRTTITSTEFHECVSQFIAGYTMRYDDSEVDRVDSENGIRSVLNYLGVTVDADRTDVWVLMHDAISTDGFTWVEADMVTADEMVDAFEKEVAGWGVVVPIQVRLVRMWVPELTKSRITYWLDENTETVESSLTVRLHTSPDYVEAKATWSKS